MSLPVFSLFGDEWEDGGTRPGWESREIRVGKRLGGELIGATLYELAPGAAICPYHEHFAEEEMALVVTGRVKLRGPEGETELGEGDMEVFLRGEVGGHLLRNVGEEPARVLMLSSLSDIEACRYPDSGKVGIWAGHALGRGKGLSLLGREAEMNVDYWEGED